LISWFLEALQAKVGTLSLEAQTKLEKDTAKKEAKAEAKADAALKKKMASQVCSFSLIKNYSNIIFILLPGRNKTDRAQ
jgi:hypothetical protein